MKSRTILSVNNIIRIHRKFYVVLHRINAKIVWNCLNVTRNFKRQNLHNTSAVTAASYFGTGLVLHCPFISLTKSYDFLFSFFLACPRTESVWPFGHILGSQVYSILRQTATLTSWETFWQKSSYYDYDLFSIPLTRR